MTTVGSLVYQFFEHHLKAERGLSQASIRSYRDGIRLLLLFMAKKAGRPISKLALSDLSADNVRGFLTYLEVERVNNIRSRNHRLAMLHTFFSFVGSQAPELLREAERVAAIPRKRAQPPATRYLERDEVEEFVVTELADDVVGHERRLQRRQLLDVAGAPPLGPPGGRIPAERRISRGDVRADDVIRRGGAGHRGPIRPDRDGR